MSAIPVSKLAPLIIPPLAKHTASVILLHGLGDTGFGWKDAVESHWRLPHVKFILPHASPRPFSFYQDEVMPAWFDRFGMSWECKEDDTGIESAKQYVYSLIEKEIGIGISSDRVMLAGFSMGGALALYSGLAYGKKLAGIVAMSCFIMQKQRFPEICTINASTPIFYAAGDQDGIVPFQLMQDSVNFIKQFHTATTFRVYNGLDHSTTAQEMDDVKDFLEKSLPRISSSI